MQLLSLIDMVNTVVADGEALYKSLNELESEINPIELQNLVSSDNHAELYRSYSDLSQNAEPYKSCTDVVSTSPSAGTEFYRSCTDVYSTSSIDLYRSCQEKRYGSELYFTSPYYRNELHNSFQKNKYTTYVCSTSSNNHDELFRSYGELYGSCEEDAHQSYSSLDNHIGVTSSHIEKSTATVPDEQNCSSYTRYQNEQPSQEFIPADALGIHKDAMDQVLMPLTAMRMDIKIYQDILYDIKDAISQVATTAVDDPLPVNKKYNRNKRTKYHKNRRSSASSENLLWLSDGEAFSTWAMDEWLVVEKV